MPALGTGQPHMPGFLDFEVSDVTASSPGLPPTTIFQGGVPITLSVTVQNNGNPLLTPLMAAAINGAGLVVHHHLQNLHTGAITTVVGGTIPPAGPLGAAPGSTVAITSPPFALPPTLAHTPYRVMTVIQANAPIAGTVAGFHDGLVLMVTP